MASDHRVRLIGRDSQFKQLSILLAPALPNPSTIVIHGPEATGKTVIVNESLRRSSISNIILQCRECITARHLFERALAQCFEAVQQHNNGPESAMVQRCENVNAFAVSLAKILERVDKFVLVLDGVDEVRDNNFSLMPALARLGEIISHLTVIMIVRYPPARLVRATGVPHIYFSPYNREQASAILSLHPPDIYPPGSITPVGYTDDEAREDNLWVWARFCQAVWDTLARGAARDLISYRALCERLWPAFVKPIVEGQFGTRDFTKLVVQQRPLLQNESALEDNLIIEDTTSTVTKPIASHEFPYFTKWLLCAAYLASYNPPRLDTLYFMKSTERKRRKKGGGTAAGRQSKTRKIPRHLLAPGTFPLDRLFAILHAILPHDYAPNIDLFTQVATLSSLRLFVRSGIYGSDPLDRVAKWRVSYSWDYTAALAQSLNFDIADYVFD